MPPETDHERWDHIGREVLAIHRDFQRRALEELTRRGHRALTPALISVLPHLDTDGSRVSDVAREAGITKQAVAKLVGELERLGYVTRSADPDDGRAVIVSFTDGGQDLLSDIRATIALIEQDYAATLGARRFRQLRTLLRELSPDGA